MIGFLKAATHGIHMESIQMRAPDRSLSKAEDEFRSYHVNPCHTTRHVLSEKPRSAKAHKLIEDL